MNANLIEMVNEEAPMGRVRGDWWYDELTDVQCHLMEALGKIRDASNTGANSVGDFVLDTTDKLIAIEDTICELLGECVAKKKLIDEAKEARAK